MMSPITSLLIVFGPLVSFWTVFLIVWYIRIRMKERRLKRERQEKIALDIVTENTRALFDMAEHGLVSRRSVNDATARDEDRRVVTDLSEELGDTGPDANDLLLIEDASDGGARRNVRIGDLPTVEEARNNNYVNVASAYSVGLGPMDSDWDGSGPTRGGTEPVKPQVQQMPKADEPRRKLDRKLKKGD